MALQFQFRRGTTVQTNAFTGALGEVTVDTDKDAIVVHDGSTAGGFPVAARADASGTITLLKKDGTSSGVINQAGLFNNTLTSTNTDQAATAAQAKVLNDKINNIIASSYGVGQTYTNVTSSKFVGTNYVNSSSKPRTVYITSTNSGGDYVAISVNGGIVVDSQTSSSFGGTVAISAVVQVGDTYLVTGSVGRWVEFN